jgi:hypothetical protein
MALLRSSVLFSDITILISGRHADSRGKNRSRSLARDGYPGRTSWSSIARPGLSAPHCAILLND